MVPNSLKNLQHIDMLNLAWVTIFVTSAVKDPNDAKPLEAPQNSFANKPRPFSLRAPGITKQSQPLVSSPVLP